MFSQQANEQEQNPSRRPDPWRTDPSPRVADKVSRTLNVFRPPTNQMVGVLFAIVMTPAPPSAAITACPSAACREYLYSEVGALGALGRRNHHRICCTDAGWACGRRPRRPRSYCAPDGRRPRLRRGSVPRNAGTSRSPCGYGMSFLPWQLFAWFSAVGVSHAHAPDSTLTALTHRSQPTECCVLETAQ